MSVAKIYNNQLNGASLNLIGGLGSEPVENGKETGESLSLGC
jgi:hypothetical protein